MADVFAVLDQADPGVVDRLAAMLERRGAEPVQRRIRQDYLGRVALPDRAQVIELGCGTGVLTRELARHPRVAAVLGIDNCPQMLDAARSADPGGQYRCADVRCLPLPDRAADVVVAHTLFSHLPDPKDALLEAWRVLVPGGQLVIFDGDYASVTSGPADEDPLAKCVDAWRAHYVFDPHVRGQLADLITDVGFTVTAEHHYHYAPSNPSYLLSIIDRGADALIANGTVGDELCVALKYEARRRVEAGEFAASMRYFLLLATRPAALP